MAISLKRATVVVELCTDLELYGQHEALTSKLAEPARSGVQDDRLTGDPVAREIVELEQKMREHVLLFTLQALPRKDWVALKAAHPAREDDEVDAAYGVNVETFVDEALTRSIISVTEKASGKVVEWDPADWQALADEMSNGQWEAFAGRLFALNNTNAGVPFSYAASKTTQSSGDN